MALDAARRPIISFLFATAALSAVLSPPPLSAGTIDPFNASASDALLATVLYNSTNWAGYAAEATQNPDDTVTAVSGSWIVPAVTPSANPLANANGQLSACMAWVGIDGYGDGTVEQVGTESSVHNGGSYYEAWFELYPNPPAGVMALFAGDSITASVQYSSTSNQFQFSLTDNTRHSGFSLSGSSSSALRATAEWIVEAPSSGTASIYPLPTFGSVTFTHAEATIASATGAAGNPDWQTTQFDMGDPAWGDAMNPTALVTAGSGAAASSSFTVIQATPEPSTLACLAAAAAFLCLHRFATRRRAPFRGFALTAMPEDYALQAA